ncbi:hypothetical protein VP1G_03558 [Cytospora mali]|uniref:Uncharacterized protein n=1 Tax=Cytospora mali TaxID=578113 RepID=A0A194UXB6_CYTMA|nr:hypothetical protein VP1G_03558 [Valsa mali var. pyri (nom. inval.)]
MASQTPKSASQRLLTMKFMQRAAAAAPPSAPSTPAADHEPSSKRRKTSGRASLGTPETQSYVIDHRAAQAALEEEERKRQALVAKHAEALGDSHWVLDAAKLPGAQQGGAPLKIVQVGFSQIDRGGGGEAAEAQEEEEEEETTTIDGPTFRSDSDSDSDDSDSDSSGSSSEGSSEEDSRKKSGRTNYGSQKRPEIRSRRSVEWEKTQKLAKERRKKEVKLNTLTSISGSGSSNFGRSNASGRRR